MEYTRECVTNLIEPKLGHKVELEPKLAGKTWTWTIIWRWMNLFERSLNWKTQFGGNGRSNVDIISDFLKF